MAAFAAISVPVYINKPVNRKRITPSQKCRKAALRTTFLHCYNIEVTNDSLALHSFLYQLSSFAQQYSTLHLKT